MRIAPSSFAAAAVAYWISASHTVLVSGLATDALVGGILCDGILPQAFCDMNDAILGSIVGSDTAGEVGPVSTPQVVDTVVELVATIAPSAAPVTAAPVTAAPTIDEKEVSEEANASGKKDKEDKEDKEEKDKGKSQSEDISEGLETDTEEADERQTVINMAARPSTQSPTLSSTPVPSTAAPITAKPTSVPTENPTENPTDYPTRMPTSTTTQEPTADDLITNEESSVSSSTVSPTMVGTVDVTMVDTYDLPVPETGDTEAAVVDDVSAFVLTEEEASAPATPDSETKVSLVAPATEIEASPTTVPTEYPTALSTFDYFEVETTNSTNSTNSTVGFIAALVVLDGNEEEFGDFGEALDGDDKRKTGGKNKAAKVSKDKTSKNGRGRKLTSTPATRRRVMHIRGLSSP